jgi:hypothetical protein
MNIQEQEEMDYGMGGWGDPRFCKSHPSFPITSNCGMFDAPCGACESEMLEDQIAYEESLKTPQERACESIFHRNFSWACEAERNSSRNRMDAPF